MKEGETSSTVEKTLVAGSNAERMMEWEEQLP